MMIISPEHALELLKEFGGGFVAYWTHHFFHKVWGVTGHLRIRKRKGREAS